MNTIVIMPSEEQDKLTGYKIYNEEAKKRTKKNNLPDLYPPLPEKKYDIIYADPPWHYGGKMQFDKSSVAKEELNPNRKIFISAAEFKYPTVKTEDLKTMEVDKFAKDDSLLFMWATSPHLTQAISLGEAWGFEYRTVAFIWNKMVHNPGQYTLSNCEMCLVFKRKGGKIPRPRGARNVQQLINSPRRAHSMKPDDVREKIHLMFPTQDKIELFARGKFKNWDEWGLDVLNDMSKEFSLTSD